MEKIIIDILEEEQDQINELMELNRRTAAAEAKLDRIFMLLENGDDDLMPFVERTKEEIVGMKEMQIEYHQELQRIHGRLTHHINKLTGQKEIEYFTPVKPTDITLEEAKKMIAEGNEKRKRARKGGIIRRGRVRYGKINKIQD